MLLSLRKNGLTSLFKEVRVFKVTQKGIHTDLLTARERENCFFFHTFAMSSCSFPGVDSTNTLSCDTLALSLRGRHHDGGGGKKRGEENDTPPKKSLGPPSYGAFHD